MNECLFPDNTVLCNFAAVDRLDLLEAVLGGRGRWTEAVAYEADKSARVLPALGKLPTDGWLDEVIEIDDETEVEQVERIRRAVFGGTDAEPLKHLGEAQTCHVILHRGEFAGSWWISDDREALRYARFQGITTRETIDLMSTAVANGDIAARDAFGLMQAMADEGRALRLPGSVADLQRWAVSASTYTRRRPRRSSRAISCQKGAATA
jgi:predicted nucleic acid-binding protein